MPRGPFWYLFVALTRRGRAVVVVTALAAEIALMICDLRIHDVEFAAVAVAPILAWAIAANYRAAVVFAGAVALAASLIETDPPNTITTPDVWFNAAIFWCGYLIALGLLRGVNRLSARLRGFLADFNELKAAHDDILPKTLPGLGDWEFVVLNVPQRDVGGVFYDALGWKGGIDLFVGTVCTSTIRAAMLLPALKGLWFGDDQLPPSSLRILNRRLSPLLKTDVTVRAWYGKFYDNGIVRYACAGFGAPFLLTTDGSVRRLAAGGAPLGTFSNGDVAEAMYVLDAGAALVLGSEGFCELVEQGAIDPKDVLSDAGGLEARLRVLPRDHDVLAVVARRKANFSFRHYLEDPLSSAQPRKLPKLEF
jgi:hypothetical protein